MYDIDNQNRSGGESFVRRHFLFLLSISLWSLGLGGVIDGYFTRPEITPDAAKFGWSEEAAKVDAPRIAALTPAFAIRDTEGNVISGAGKESSLWRFAKLCNNGKHIPTWRQESGDCVSMGWSNAIAYRQGYQIIQEGRFEKLEIPFPPYMYGISRVQVGKRQLGRGAGSIGAWAGQGSQGYGVVNVSQVTKLGIKYSGKLADKYGWEGPPEQLITLGKKHRVNQISQVKSWEDARDALAYGFPVTIASNVGFEGGYYDKDGKRFLRPAGKWPHQMCLIGMDDRPGHEKGAYCINSWGVDAHPKPIGDEPPGGFWIDWQTVQRITSQGDSWAYSDFDGFTISREDAVADWSIFKETKATEILSESPQEAVAALEAVEKPAEQTAVETIKEVRKWNATHVGIAFLISGTLSFVRWTGRRRRRESSCDCHCSF